MRMVCKWLLVFAMLLGVVYTGMCKHLIAQLYTEQVPECHFETAHATSHCLHAAFTHGFELAPTQTVPCFLAHTYCDRHLKQHDDHTIALCKLLLVVFPFHAFP